MQLLDLFFSSLSEVRTRPIAAQNADSNQKRSILPRCKSILYNLSSTNLMHSDFERIVVLSQGYIWLVYHSVLSHLHGDYFAILHQRHTCIIFTFENQAWALSPLFLWLKINQGKSTRVKRYSSTLHLQLEQNNKILLKMQELWWCIYMMWIEIMYTQRKTRWFRKFQKSSYKKKWPLTLTLLYQQLYYAFVTSQ